MTAVAHNTPAERAGLVVGDRIVAVGDQDFLRWTRPDIAKTLRCQYNADTYLGVADLTIAKPVYALQQQNSTGKGTVGDQCNNDSLLNVLVTSVIYVFLRFAQRNFLWVWCCQASFAHQEGRILPHQSLLVKAPVPAMVMQ
jgi:hypothetical protein